MKSGGKILIELALCEVVAALPRGKTSGCAMCPCKLCREPVSRTATDLCSFAAKRRGASVAEQIGEDAAARLCRRRPPVSMQDDYTTRINVRRCRSSNGLNRI